MDGEPHHYQATDQLVNHIMEMGHDRRMWELEKLAMRIEPIFDVPELVEELDLLETGFVESLANAWMSSGLDPRELLTAFAAAPRARHLVALQLHPY